ncbi:MAG TPA: GAF domain-containing protein [Candidatus Methylomirabilis sp.]|nr:GAF domain-containing protein [Candidatus Methylomirabilis sp.]
MVGRGSIEPDRDVSQESWLIELEALRRRCAELEHAVVEAKRTQAVLTEGEEKYRQLFATVSDAIVVFDAETRRFVDVNQRALRLYGYTRDEFLSLTHGDITAEPAASEASIRETLTGMGTGVPLRYHKKKDGTVFPVEISAGAFVWEGRSAVCGVIRDITDRKRVEAALLQSEVSLNRAQQVAHIGSWHLDVIRGELTWSEETYRIFGVPIATPVTYERFLETVHPDDRESVVMLWAAALTGEPYTFEHRILVAGETKWVRENAEVEFDEDGTALRGIGTVQDITDRKQAEDALRIRTQQLEALRAVGDEITRELDLPTLLNLIMHRATELVGGASGTIYLWDEAQQVLHPRVWASHGEWMREGRVEMGEGLAGLVAERQEGLIVNDYRTWPHARPFILNQTNITAVVAEPLLYRDRLLGVIAVDDQGTGRRFTEQDRELLRLFAIQAAVAIENARLFAATEQRAAQLKTLRDIGQAIAARLELPEVLNAVVSGTMELLGSPHAQIALWDEATRRLRRGAAGGTHATMVGTDDIPLGEGVMGMVALTWQPLVVNDYQASRYASPHYPDVRATITVPVVFEDRLLAVLHAHTTRPGKSFTANDRRRLQMVATQTAIAIENARLYEQVREYANELERKVEERTQELQAANTQLRAANAELEAFSYSVSHDLRTPLLSIKGFSRVLLKKYERVLGEEGMDYLRRVQTGAQRMGEIIEALLGLARVTRHPLQQEPVDLSAQARTIVNDLRQRDLQREAEVIIQDGLVVRGDARLLCTLLENLLGNAWKFTANRRPTRIQVGRCSGEAGAAVYFVGDNGVGFDMAEADQLFGMFQRLQGAEQFPGTGIGLATVQRIVERHGGRVWAEGVIEGGATFFFTLDPLAGS